MRFIFWALAAIIALFLIVLLTPIRAHADDGDKWIRDALVDQCKRDGFCFRRHYYQQRYQRFYHQREYAERYRRPYREVELRHYASQRDDEQWERRDAGSERGVNCKDSLVRVVGTEHLTEAAAKDAAVRQWQAAVRYDHGERFLNIDNSRQMRWRCDRSGTNETVAGRVGEAVSGGSAYLKRCVVIARPCMMPVSRADKDRDDR